VIRLDARYCDDNLIVELKALLGEYPGPSEVHLEMVTASGPRRLRFGSGYRVRESAHLRAEIEHLLAPEARVA
jgi:hypothetical protein